MRLLSLCSAIALAATATAQLGISLPPALQSIGDALQSLANPSDTPSTPTPAPKPTPSPKTPKPAPAPPPVTTSSSNSLPTSTSSTLTTSSSTQQTTASSISTSTHSTSTTSDTTSTQAESIAAPTEPAKQNTSGGLSHGAKVGIGVGIGVAVIVGLIAAALYSFIRDRHASDAYAAWRERRAKKHGRLGSSATNASFRGAAGVGEKEMELKQVEHGAGTYTAPPAPYTAAPPPQPSPSLDKQLPGPPVAYQQAKQVQIKRKAVPGQAPQKPRFSWMQ